VQTKHEIKLAFYTKFCYNITSHTGDRQMKKLSAVSRIKMLEKACQDPSLTDHQVDIMARVILTAPQVNLSELIAQAKANRPQLAYSEPFSA